MTDSLCLLVCLPPRCGAPPLLSVSARSTGRSVPAIYIVYHTHRRTRLPVTDQKYAGGAPPNWVGSVLHDEVYVHGRTVMIVWCPVQHMLVLETGVCILHPADISSHLKGCPGVAGSLARPRWHGGVVRDERTRLARFVPPVSELCEAPHHRSGASLTRRS